MYSHPEADETFVADWMEMYDKTFEEDADVVRVQQAGLSSQMIPYGRLLPKSESPIRHFHRLVLRRAGGRCARRRTPNRVRRFARP